MRKYQRLLSKSYYPRLLAFRHVTQSYHSRNSKYPGVKKRSHNTVKAAKE
ncbi:MAG: reverse transcriptase N-terminal domain-containing protein [Trichodesmium sp. St2_bin6]|nr:reverse transcriptase N-terminal domain-containing protein [Trichodesmium sp. ALOHA_ZT_67]MDE5077054.1 reverse transcriptase N-terminal domain-containing protein [Trichodesmium sp. St2_bin6]MDE5102078.1 reverse transcriptase N-terminal domain-containing protein [Trichodesmium sp. St19_bin2]